MIEFLKLNAKQHEKTVLFIGVFHGDEPLGELLIRKFLTCVEEKKYDASKFKNRLIFIPVLNESGKALNTRKNSNGVDLNRNFPTANFKVVEKDDEYFGGFKSASEKETQFLIDILNENQIDCVVSFHQPYKCVNFDGVGDEVVKIAEKISEITGYPTQENIGYETYGSFGTYCGKELKIPTITLELPENETFEQVWKNNIGVFEFFAFEY